MHAHKVTVHIFQECIQMKGCTLASHENACLWGDGRDYHCGTPTGDSTGVYLDCPLLQSPYPAFLLAPANLRLDVPLWLSHPPWIWHLLFCSLGLTTAMFWTPLYHTDMALTSCYCFLGFWPSCSPSGLAFITTSSLLTACSGLAPLPGHTCQLVCGKWTCLKLCDGSVMAK